MNVDVEVEDCADTALAAASADAAPAVAAVVASR